jgi:hypothetical protein
MPVRLLPGKDSQVSLSAVSSGAADRPYICLKRSAKVRLTGSTST